MIPQAELDRALARWKARRLGLPSDAQTPPVVLTTPPVEATVITATAEVEVHDSSSGVIQIGDMDYDEQG